MLKIRKIIVKFLGKEAGETELEELETCLKDAKNISTFNQLVRIEYLISLCMKKYNLDKAKESIDLKLKEEERKRKLMVYRNFSVAASILLIFGISFYTMNESQSVIIDVGVEENKIVESGTDKAILTLEDGQQVTLEKGKKYSNEKLSSNGEELVYNSQKHSINNEKLTYNYLTVPRGGQFFLKLSDGTQVWVNSESKLKYPTKFISGSTREVELEYGEAYFEVSPSSKHNGVSFNVYTRGQKVNVLGTEFNIRALKSDTNVATTLAGGKVMVEKGSARKFLEPNQQSIVTDNTNTITLKEVDASIVTSWVQGLFVFEDESLHQMMDDLSRWYDIEVFFKSQKFRDIPFTGVLERTKSLNELLEVIEASSEGEVKFEIKNEVLIIQ